MRADLTLLLHAQDRQLRQAAQAVGKRAAELIFAEAPADATNSARISSEYEQSSRTCSVVVRTHRLCSCVRLLKLAGMEPLS